MSESGRKRVYWNSRLGVIMAVAASAVGLGNFLRFPGLAAKYEGGVFMIPYFISLLILGIPICWCEWSLGRYGGRRGYNSPPGIFRVITGRRWGHYLGVLALVVPIVIYMYYVYIESWCLAYAWQYATGEIVDQKQATVAVATLDLPPDLTLPNGMRYDPTAERLFVTGKMTPAQRDPLLAAALAVPGATAEPTFAKAVGDLYTVSNDPVDAYREHFFSYVGIWQDGYVTSAGMSKCAIFLVIVFLLNFYFIYGGLNKGIEKLCEWAEPVLVIAAVIVLVRVLTLGVPDPSQPERNVMNGLGFMWNIDGTTLAKLNNPTMWLEAAGQVFFTLSVGMGVILTYASYMRPKDDVVLSGLTACAANEFCEVVLGGLITIPAAFIFLGPAVILATHGSTLGLGFLTFPAIFEQMWFGRFFGFLWFGLLFLAAITSSVSMLQPAIAFLEEGLGLGRKASVAVIGLVTAMGALIVVYFSSGMMALDIMDFWIGQVFVFVIGAITIILFGWVFGIERGWAEAHRGAHIRIPSIYKPIIKYVSPLYLIIILVLFVKQNAIDNIDSPDNYVYKILHSPSAQFTMFFLAIVVAFFTVLVARAGRNWDRNPPAPDPEVREP